MATRTIDRTLATLQTTDATTGTCGTYTVPTSSACQVQAHILGRTAGAVVGTFWRHLAAQRGAGGAVIVGAETAVVGDQLDAGAAAWTAVLDVSGNDVRVRVTGAAATTIEWLAVLDVVTWTP